MCTIPMYTCNLAVQGMRVYKPSICCIGEVERRTPRVVYRHDACCALQPELRTVRFQGMAIDIAHVRLLLGMHIRR